MGGRSIEAARHVTSGLEELVTGVRAAVSRHADWRETARLVTRELARHLPSPDVLTAEQRIGTRRATAATFSTPSPTGASQSSRWSGAQDR